MKAVSKINEARSTSVGVTVDLHPDRPIYRGFLGPLGPVSLERDPTFEEIEAAGGTVVKNDQPHAVLDDMFLVSGEIPRVTPFEEGFKRGMRFNSGTESWESDELILDERFLMCNLKGTILPTASVPRSHFSRERPCRLHWVQSRRGCQRGQTCLAIGRGCSSITCSHRRIPPGWTQRSFHPEHCFRA